MKYLKQLILICSLLIVLSNSLYAAKFNWEKIVETNDDATHFYIDRKTIFKVGNYKYFWALSNYLISDPDDGPEKSVVNHFIVNCNSYELKTITFTSYLQHMGRGEVSLDFILPEAEVDEFKWHKFDPKKHAFGYLIDEVCNSR
tara:strand:- start:101 stop:532 length:432 start_codon:yes stop_codon:yes gene_type:complete